MLIGVILLLNYTPLGKYYKITNFDINATIHSDGSMSVTEITDYKFSQDYNGITITIPENINSVYYNSNNFVKGQNISNSLYNNSGISNLNIYLVTENKDEKYKQVETAALGDKGVYTVSRSNGYVTYKIYEPSCNENKTFKITYTLNNVVVKHTDIAEVFWNFIGGSVDCKIEDLNIKVSVDGLQNTDNVIATHHGNITGSSKFTGTTFNTHFSHVSAGEFVGVRFAFPNSLVNKSSKTSGLAGIPLITEFEEHIKEMSDIRRALNIIAITFSILLFIYWIFLYVKFEKERVIFLKPDDELKILDKYNPMIAACIAQDRGMHPRDIIAVLINLVNKKILDMEVRKEYINDEEKTLYYIEQNKDFFKDPENITKLDQIEKLIIEMFFENNSKIELENYTKQISTDAEKIKKLQLLDKQASIELNKIGANKELIPKPLLTFHTFIFVFVCIFIVGVIWFNLYLSNFTIVGNISDWLYIILVLFPLILGLLAIILKVLNFLIVSLKRGVRKLAYKFTNKDIITTSAEIISISLIVFLILALVSRETYILAITVLFAISLLIIKTDNLMTKHSTTVLKDYFILKTIQNKIENSLLNEKNIESQLVWDKYLTFSIALGYTLTNEYSESLTFVESFDTLINSLADTFLDLAYIERDSYTTQRLNNFGKFTGKLFKVYCKSISSCKSSSFGGGGFSGGGGGGGGRGAF